MGDSNIAIVMSIVNQVQSRELDKLYELEENLNIKEQTPLQVLTNDKGTQSDKIRYLLFLILRDVIKLNEIEKYKEELEKQNCPFLKAIDYVKKIKSMSNAQSNQNESSQAGQMIGSFMNMGISLAQNVVGATKKLPVTRLVDQIIDNKDTQGIEVDYLDPKMSSVNTMARSKTMPTDVVVFVVGGGCYSEYLELRESRKNMRIVYGCTDLINPEYFLQELQELGAE